MIMALYCTRMGARTVLLSKYRLFQRATMQASREMSGGFRVNGRKSVYVRDHEHGTEAANKRYVDTSIDTVIANIETGNNSIPWSAITGEPVWIRVDQSTVLISDFNNNSGYITLAQVPDQAWSQITSTPA